MCLSNGNNANNNERGKTMLELKQTLIERDGLTSEEADAQIEEAKDLIQEYLDEGDMESAYNVCEEMWCLEPDYLMDIMPI
jgi:hypothetical protein